MNLYLVYAEKYTCDDTIGLVVVAENKRQATLISQDSFENSQGKITVKLIGTALKSYKSSEVLIGSVMNG